MAMFRFFVIASLAAALAGCAASRPAVPISAEASTPTLLPGETVDVQVYGQAQMSGPRMVESDGAIPVLLVGRVKVAGMTPPEVETLIQNDLSRRGLVSSPSVSVEVVHYLPVSVVGEVAKPGAFEWRYDMRALDAVAMAGGYTYRANTGGLEILPESDPQRKPVPASAASRLMPGDVVVVPERWF